jgi:hypothetical protein
MCLGVSLVRNVPRWNWDGDHIVHECIVPSSRPVVGYSRRHAYDIDVREFLVTSRNEVIRRTLVGDVRALAEKHEGGWEFFESRKQGSFDFRAAIVMEFVSKAIAYSNGRAADPWQFPDETLKVREGDCEDRALLIASLLIASGISNYNIRVALGKMRLRKPNGRFADRDHVWVMYKNEAGRWRVIEPLLLKKKGRTPRRTERDRFTPSAAEYIPYFLFNDSHLWQVYHADNAEPVHRFELKRSWSELHPRFAGIVHKNIISEALDIPECPANVRDRLLSYFSFGYLGIPVVDNYDRDFSDYDPADHFDNGQIRAGWKKVAQRLTAFKQDESDLEAFGAAAHGIADFYAHTSFIHFAHGPLVCDPAAEHYGLVTRPTYGSDSTFNLARPDLSINARLWKGTREEGAKAWDGDIISGRYAQAQDSRTFLESINRTVTGLASRCGALPHHAEMAVDGGDDKQNVLYDADQYDQQLGWRRQAAVLHIRQAFRQSYK